MWWHLQAMIKNGGQWFSKLKYTPIFFTIKGQLLVALSHS
jgi:hypothetical protein